jgi:hypothetical protein
MSDMSEFGDEAHGALTAITFNGEHRFRALGG